MQYIHYGHREFCSELFVPVKNEPLFSKPTGGFWASPVDTPNGWKQWCERENFRKCNDQNAFVFSLSESARVLHIRKEQDLKKLPKAQQEVGFFCLWTCLDFEELARKYDAIELHLSEDYFLYQALYGWDCDSILILHPEIIVF